MPSILLKILLENMNGSLKSGAFPSCLKKHVVNKFQNRDQWMKQITTIHLL